jgi:hypothetical protein
LAEWSDGQPALSEVEGSSPVGMARAMLQFVQSTLRSLEVDLKRQTSAAKRRQNEAHGASRAKENEESSPEGAKEPRASSERN